MESTSDCKYCLHSINSYREDIISGKYDLRVSSSTIIVTIIMGLLIIATIVANLLICITFCMVQSVRQPKFYLVVSLAVTDILIAIMVSIKGKYRTIDNALLLISIDDTSHDV